MTFRVGQKVVCIRSDFKWKRTVPPNLPIKGRVYTVRDILPTDEWGPPALRLIELINPIATFAYEPCFSFTRFRPIVSRKTSIEIFTRMLKPSQVDA